MRNEPTAADWERLEANFRAWAKHECERISARTAARTPEWWERFWELNPRLRPPGNPRDRVKARLWDVCWTDGHFGKHGNGPFLTKGQATRCLRAVGWPGTVEPVLCEMHRADLDRILRRAPRASAADLF